MTQVTGPAGGHTALLAREECDRLEQRLQHAVAEFVDEPRHAVEEADRTLEEIAARFTDAVTRRRRTLRMSWQNADAPGSTADDTEQLRLALRDYRELAELLLHEGGGDGAHNATGSAGSMRSGSEAGSMRPEARPPATDARRDAMAKPQEESPTVAPTPRSAEYPQRTDRGDIA
ncbi:hypothetical protein ACIQ6Y_09620 [Streptomyces sp. NPDC096205]|uniref:hypothetical protein n=1 Tax=Streptomyces sp. NPDC096205 TaxID=3366081 RepID=UPI0037FBE48A